MDIQKILTDAQQLSTWLSKREMKYLRNLNRYNNNGQRREDIWNLYNDPVSYNFGASEGNMLPWPIENVIKSCIDTKLSKMSQVKVRPFFNPVNGKWQTRKVCRIGQQWSDQWYQRESIYQLANLCYRDAQIFEAGHIWIDEETKKPRRLRPWEYFYDPAEFNYGCLSRVMIELRQYPLAALKAILKEGTAPRASYDQNPFYRADKYRIYYLLEEGVRYDIVDGVLMRESAIKFKRSPVASIYYCPPVKGMWSPSLVDDLITLQRELDLVNEKIHDAEENTPANLIFTPTIGGIKASTLDAGKAGLVYEYEPAPGATAPATVVTPAAVSPQLLQRRKEIIEAMYNISGVSMLSAQSKKPSGINSGVMLDTLEDVESERFNRELQDFEKFLMQICEIAVDALEGDLLPKRAGRSTVTWKDLQREREFFSVQFSPASALSNTPKVKMEQVEKLQKMGIVGPEWVASMLQFPDLEKCYGIAAANRDDIEMVTERAAEEGDFEFYEVVSLPDLYKNVMNEIMRLDADEGENEKIIRNLVEFLGVIKGKMDELQSAAQPPAPPEVPQPTQPAGPPAPPPAAPPVALGQPAEPIPQASDVLASAPTAGGPI